MTEKVDIITLKDLEIGDIFIPAKDLKKTFPKRFVVRGASVFNRWHGSPTRMCIDLRKNETVSKSCRVTVIKVGVSKFAEQYKLKPINKR